MKNIKNQNSYLVQQDLVEHAKNPKNYGLLANFDFKSLEHNPSCGDSISVCGTVNGDILEEVRFEGKGCMLSLAMASKLTDFVKGKSLVQAMALGQETVKELLGIELGPNRIQCGMLSIFALKGALLAYQKQKTG